MARSSSTHAIAKRVLTDDDRRIPPHLRATLVVIEGPDRDACFTLAHSQTLVGRGSVSDIQLTDESISRRHMAVQYRNLEFRLIDLDSANGTFLNGSRVTDYALHNGDRIQIGLTLLVFRVTARDDEDDP